MSILIQKLPRHESNSGQVCSVCFHAVSNHNVSVDTRKSKQMAKLHSCNVCKSRKCKW